MQMKFDWYKVLGSCLVIHAMFLEVTVYQVLVIASLITLSAWFVQFHWRRRKLYRAGYQRKGPLALPFIGSALYFAGSTKDILQSVISIVNEYEPPVPVWIGNRLNICIVDPKDMEIILNHPHSIGKDLVYRFSNSTVGTGIFTAPVEKWKRNRKLINPAFNQKILDGFVEVFAEQASVLADQLKREVGRGIFDVFDYASRCAVDIICETEMGVSVNAQVSDSEYLKWANRAMHIMFKRMFNIALSFDFIFKWHPLAKDLEEVNGKIHKFTGGVVRQKREAHRRRLREGYVDGAPRRNNLLQQLIELSEDGETFTDEELRMEVDTFMMAGSDTTASVSSYILLMLAMFPDVQEKVYEEVMDVLGPDRPCDVKDLGRFVYLERVMRETMRLFPPGSVFGRNVTGDIQLEKCMVPAGSTVLCVIFALHRNPDIYPDPLRFDPDRFAPEAKSKRHSYSWLPFSAGPRNCIGIKYALMVLKVLIATVVRRYRFSSDYTDISKIDFKVDVTLKPIMGHRVAVELRE
ncbi:cytochrome P450 4c21-like [Photinus pyralis]|nr:cytochrome P450 4c21-like [Photinus pyralis]